MMRSGVNGQKVLIAIRSSAMIFAPRHFGGIRVEIAMPDMMVDTDFRAAQPGKEKLRLIGASAVVGISLRMIDALHVVQRVQLIP